MGEVSQRRRCCAAKLGLGWVVVPRSGCARREKWPQTGPIDGLDKRWRAWRARRDLSPWGRAKAKLKNLQQDRVWEAPFDS